MINHKRSKPDVPLDVTPSEPTPFTEEITRSAVTGPPRPQLFSGPSERQVKRVKCSPLACPATPRHKPSNPPGPLPLPAKTQHYPHTIKLLTSVFSTAQPAAVTPEQSWLTSHRTCVSAATAFPEPSRGGRWQCGRDWIGMNRPVAGVLSHLSAKPLDTPQGTDYSLAIHEIAHLLDLIRYFLSHPNAIQAMMAKIGHLGKGQLEAHGTAATDGTHWLRFTQALLTSMLLGLVSNLDSAMAGQSPACVEAITSRAMQAFMRNILNSLEVDAEAGAEALTHYATGGEISAASQMVDVVSKMALALMSQRLGKIPKDVVSHTLRPALLQFCSSELSLGLVQGIHNTIELFPGLFSGSFGQKLVDILSHLARPAVSESADAMDTDADASLPNEEVVMVKLILDIFRIFSAVGKIDCSPFVGSVCQSVAQLANRSPSDTTFDDSLLQFLHHYPESTVQFFFSLKTSETQAPKTSSPEPQAKLSVRGLLERVIKKDAAFAIRTAMEKTINGLIPASDASALRCERQSDFSDLSLRVVRGSETQSFDAHRVVLSRASPVLAALLSNGMQETSQEEVTLELPNELPALGQVLVFGPSSTPFAAFEVALQYMYDRVVPATLPEDSLVELLAIADMLQLPRLLVACEAALERAVGVDTVGMLLALSEFRQTPQRECSSLYTATRTFVKSHAAQVDRRLFVAQIAPLGLVDGAQTTPQGFAEQLLGVY